MVWYGGVCVRTGSGKTHTMQGAGNQAMRGIIPRAIEQVGVTKAKLETQGWVFNMQVSFVEIYNEVLKDLLNEDNRFVGSRWHAGVLCCVV